LLNAKAQLKGADGGRFVVVDPTGKETALPLAS
jgi:hypothetical protein